MRIALVAPLVTTIAEPFVGGSQAVVATLAQGLSQRGHEVTLFARAGSHVPGVVIEPLAVPDSVLPSSFVHLEQGSTANAGFFAQANIFLELFLRLQEQKTAFDIIHAHAFDWPSFTSSLLLREQPIIHTIHLPAISPEINEALRVVDSQGHPLTLISVSHACARDYSPYTSIDHVIYNGLNLDAIPFSARVEENAPLLFAGRITPEKGVEDALEIARRVGQPLLLAGGIYDQEYYDKRIVPYLQQDRGRAKYLGQLKQSDLWKLMGQCRGVLFPCAWDEPFGLVAVEAMATGTPVIAYRRGAAEEVIDDGKTGFLTEPGSHNQAAEAINKLGTIVRSDCRRYIEDNFSLHRMLDEHERVYASLLHRTNLFS